MAKNKKSITDNVTAVSKLRSNIYQELDAIIATGNPLIVSRKGHLLRISLEKPISKLARLKKRTCIIGDPDAIVESNWSNVWNEEENL
jgi:hypothetical protein